MYIKILLCLFSVFVSNVYCFTALEWLENGKNSKDNDYSIVCYENCISLDSNNIIAHNNIAYLYFDNREFDKALYHNKYVLNLNPNEIYNYNFMSIIYSFKEIEIEKHISELRNDNKLSKDLELIVLKLDSKIAQKSSLAYYKYAGEENSNEQIIVNKEIDELLEKANELKSKFEIMKSEIDRLSLLKKDFKKYSKLYKKIYNDMKENEAVNK